MILLSCLAHELMNRKVACRAPVIVVCLVREKVAVYVNRVLLSRMVYVICIRRKCIRLVGCLVVSPVEDSSGRVCILGLLPHRGQVAETHRVRDLAQMIADKTGCGINFMSNPRNEAAENELEVKNDKFGNLGVDFKSLDESLLEEVSTCLL